MPAKYTMRISRLTVDKLGVKLYDKVSAVLAELIANAYDADAQNVTIHAPMGKYLAGKANGQVQDKGFEIKIEDDGAGMTPDEMQAFFLVIGAERRTDPQRGGVSTLFGRKVMGRKGVGKLAPFGICKVMEVISAGGKLLKEDGKTGHRTSHIILNYDDIIAVGDEPDEPYQPQVGPKDGTLSEVPGTVISLRDFDYRRVSEIDTLARQIAQRFGIQSQEWQISLRDNGATSNAHVVGAFDVETMPNTRINFLEKGKVAGPDGADLRDIEAGFTHEDAFHSVTGWMGYSKAPYRDELMAGARIYCRGKIAAQSTIFNQPAGFTGEHNIRSYLVGELHADWLDERVDLIQTDRRDILWSNDFPELKAGEADDDVPNHVAARISDRNLERLRNTPVDGGDRQCWPDRLVLDCHKKIGGYTDVYGRMAWERPAPTLTSKCNSISNGRYGHPEQDRAISLREAAAIQTFPDDYVFYGMNGQIARQIGNAVPVAFAEVLGRHILDLHRRS